jgi:UV DNA damage endonuclease
MIRFGLCCIFKEKPIKFRRTYAANLANLSRAEILKKLSGLCLHNSKTLFKALETVNEMGIKSFRVQSQIFPLFTHPDVGYHLEELPERKDIFRWLEEVRNFAENNDIRLSFHPDQFVILSSPREKVVKNSIAELDYQALVSELIGAEAINIHLGGVYDGKEKAIKRFSKTFSKLPERVKKRLTLENDDISYTIKDLQQPCMDLSIPLVYDVHHHRCNPDGLSISEATAISVKTWKTRKQEPYFHISSPKFGWNNGNAKPHSDYIDIKDFPKEWLKLSFTLDVEAKAKELAVVKLMEDVKKLK